MTTMFAASLFSLEKIIPFAVFGLFAAAAFWALEYFAGRKNRADERLDELRNPLSRRRDQAGKGKKQDAMSKMLEKATPVFSAPLKPKTEVETSKLKLKLSQAGFRSDAASSIF